MISFCIVWVVCGFLAYGLILGHFTHEFPYMNNARYAMLVGCTGPFGLLVMIMFNLIDCNGTFYWRVKPLSVYKRWEIYQKEYPLTSGNGGFERFRDQY